MTEYEAGAPDPETHSRTDNPKSIVLCSDGTWNRGGPGAPTNVWRIHQAVDRSTAITVHDNGVGTEANFLSKFLGGAFGVGLYPNVADLYAFLIRHYEPGMKIYLFGFSRGAFTVRLLSGVIGMFGVVDRTRYDGAPEEAAKKVVHAFRLIHAQDIRDERRLWTRWSKFLLGRKPHFEDFAKSFREEFCHPPEEGMIHFLGVWDTVRAIAGPFDPLVRAFNFILCISFHDNYLSKSVRLGCQALAVDENRLTFEPIPWEEKDRQGDPDPRVRQLWFAGCHSDVGGGYAKQGLASVALDWMMTQAEEAWQNEDGEMEEGLRFDRVERMRVRAAADPHCALHNPRVNKGLFYRYQPRTVPADATYHGSLVERLTSGTNGYAPGNLKPSAFGGRRANTAFRWKLTYHVRSVAHAVGLGLVLVFIAASLFVPISWNSPVRTPVWAQSGLEGLGSWITKVVPTEVFDEVSRRPLDVLQDHGLLFWGLFGVLLFSFVVCCVSRRWMESRAARIWRRFRGDRQCQPPPRAPEIARVTPPLSTRSKRTAKSHHPKRKRKRKHERLQFTGAALPLPNKLLLFVVSLGMIVVLFAAWDMLNKAWFPKMESIHQYHVELFSAEMSDGCDYDQSFLFGQEEINEYNAQDGAGLHTALDFLFMVFYGGIFLFVFRTLLLGYPQHLYRSLHWCFWLFGLPLCLGLFADLLENMLLLHARTLDEPSALVGVVPYLTLAKTCLITFVFLCLVGLGVLVLCRGKADPSISRIPDPKRSSGVAVDGESARSIPEKETKADKDLRFRLVGSGLNVG